MNLIVVALILAVVFSLFWLYMIFFNSSGDVIVKIKRMNTGMRVKTTYGTFIEEGEPKIKKIKIDKDFKIPYWEEYFEFDDKGKPILKIFIDINGDPHPIKTVYDAAADEFKEVVDRKNMKYWFTIETRERVEKYQKKQSLLEKVLPALALIIAGMIFFFSLYYSNEVHKKTMEIEKTIHDDNMINQKQTSESLAVSAKALEQITPILDRLSGGNYVGIRNG